MKKTPTLQSQTSEPLIVVEESSNQDDDKGNYTQSPDNSDEEESPVLNPYLLSPWRDSRETRKHSLPTPQCSGITASQVRRLSERGDGTSGPSARQAEFLATLSSAPAPVPGGRRHSVVTISKVPTTIFGRNRRESVATFPSAFPARILPGRRESVAGPPSTEPRGSVHNLQLDIMDDIVQARKVRMKLWNTSSEKVCEVQPLDEAGGVQRYTNSSSRRFSDFVGTTLTPIPSSTSRRRASELPPPNTTCPTTTSSKQSASGIICSNSDLISILSTLTLSASEINNLDHQSKIDYNKDLTAEQRRGLLKSKRSNSFDISILHGIENETQNNYQKSNAPAPANWFVKRHQPLSNKLTQIDKKPPRVTFSYDTIEKDNKKQRKSTDELNKVVWDERSGSLVDAELLGNAIESFLRRTSCDNIEPQTTPPRTISPNKAAISKSQGKNAGTKHKSTWFSNKTDDDSSTETCDSSLCSTLKDLFVK